MKRWVSLAGVIVSSAVALAACASQAPAPKPPAEKPVEQPAEKPADTTQQAATAEQPAETKEFVASEELYKKTFDEVQAAIAALTTIIAAGDYDQWLTYLTADYVATTGSAERLAAASSSAALKKNGIVLHSLRDYFNQVVVKSHMQVTLDDIMFVDATHVKAITKIQNKPIILYYLVREDGRWKVGIQQSSQS